MCFYLSQSGRVSRTTKRSVVFFFHQFTAIQILNYAIWWFWLTFLTTARTLYIYAFGFCRRQLAASFGMEMLIRSTLCSPCNYIKRWKQLDNWSLFTVWESQFPTLSRSTFSVWICPSAIFKQGKKFPLNAILEKKLSAESCWIWNKRARD